MKRIFSLFFIFLISYFGNTQLLTEGFDTGIPGTWTQEYVSGTISWVSASQNQNSTITPRTGSGMAHFVSGGYGDKTKLVTPQLNLTALVTPQITFYFANVNWATDVTKLSLFYKTSATGAWTQIGATYTAEHAAWTKVELLLPNPSADYYFAFEGESQWARGVEIDDVVIGEAPACLPPSALTATNMATTTADLAWTENGTATTWNIEYGAVGFTPSGGTTITGTTTNPHSLTGLTANTSYDFYVQSDCGSGDLSAWVGPYSFTTPPGAHTIPLSEDFEAGFTNFDNANGNNVDWAITTSYFNGGTQSIHNAHGSNNNNILHESGILDLSSTTNTLLEFWHIAKTEGGWDKCYVEISTDNGATYTTLPNSAYQGAASDYSTSGYFHEDSYSTWGTGSQTPDNTTWWKKETFSLAAYNVANVRIRFRNTSDGSGNRAGWYLDDILISEPSCLAPSTLSTSSLTATSTDLAWTENGTATTWNVEWGPTGFTPGGGTMVTGTTTNPQSISGLSATTTYDFYVQADCGGSLSSWSSVASFTTPCASYIPDYTTNFSTFLPACWDEADAGTSSTGPSSLGSGSWSNSGTRARTNLYSNNKSDWLLTPSFDLSLGGYELVLNTNATDYSPASNFGGMGSDDEVQVVVSSDGGTTWSVIHTWDAANPLLLSANDFSININPYTGTNVQFGIIASEGSVSDSEDYYVYINNFEIQTAPVCSAPSALTATSITANSASLGWTENGTASSWDIEYGTTGFTQGGGTTISGTSTNPYALTGLALNTTYQYYVRSNCTSNQSVWVGPLAFTTLCPANAGTAIVTACDTYTWIDGNTYSTSNNAATHTLMNVNGCDSIVTLNLTINNSSTGTDTQVACDSYTWIDGVTYTTSNNIATHTLTNAANCDSVVSLNLTIKNSSTGTDTQVSCDSYTWIDGVTYTASNNSATHTLTNAANCDSVVTLDLTINYSNTGTDTQVACNSYTWIDGITYTASNNTATQILTNAANCDSVVTLNLTINHPVTGTDTRVACGTFTWIDGVTYTADNNTATHTIVGGSVHGCDSTVTLDLSISNILTGTDTQTACESFTWIDGNTYTSSNNSATHNIVGGSANGCDSIVTLNLTINYSNTGTDVITACDSYTWIDGMTYTASNNTATHTLTNAVNCDSVVTLDLTINYSNTGTDVITACDSYTWIDGMTYTASNNTATHTLTNAANCDSVVTLDLTINYSSTGVDTQVACNSYTWIDGVTYTASNNTATHILTNAVSCDSIVTLDLTINYSNTGVDTQVACVTYTWIDGVTYTSSNNTATHTLTNAANCDSVVTLDLTINSPNTGLDVVTACDSYTWIDGLTYSGSNNIATHTLINAAGCDSVVTLNLTINNAATGTDVITACDNYIWINGLNYVGSNNSATHTILGGAANGCDSIVTLNLTIINSASGTDVITACDSYTWIDGMTYTASNSSAMHTIVGGAANGCDSIVTLNLTINNSTTGIDTQVACETFAWIDGMVYTASNNTATHTIVGGASNGCDSIVTLDLTIDAANSAGPDASIPACLNQPVDLDTLVSLGLMGTWLDDMNMPITGTQVTLSDTPGSYVYKYVVASGSCPADTAIVTVVIDGSCDYLRVTSEALVDISVYPNPASSVLTILNPSNTSSLKMELLDMNGRVVLVENSALNNATKATLTIDYLETGVYTLRVYNNDGQKIFKIVKR